MSVALAMMYVFKSTNLRFRGNFNGKLNGRFLGKTSLPNNFQMKSGVVGGGGEFGAFSTSVSKPVFHR